MWSRKENSNHQAFSYDYFFIYSYRNTLYWDAALKSKNLGISACIKHSFWPFLDYGFNAASNLRKLVLNAAFNIEILINFL